MVDRSPKKRSDLSKLKRPRPKIPESDALTASFLKRTLATDEEQEALPLLPPGRYHYSEDTKINAIGILVQKKSDKDYEVIEEAIRRLGRADLHSALQALEYLDVAGDDLIYKTVTEYLRVDQPEYRIYCAWLLRERYGSKPAGFITQLLMDREMRVHQYTAEIFENRLIEKELIEEILRRIGSSELMTWQITHFVRLLGKKERFYPEDLERIFGARIIDTLEPLLNHRQASIRLEVYRTISQYPSFFSPDSIKRRIKNDTDRYVRALADKLWPDF